MNVFSDIYRTNKQTLRCLRTGRLGFLGGKHLSLLALHYLTISGVQRGIASSAIAPGIQSVWGASKDIVFVEKNVGKCLKIREKREK